LINVCSYSYFVKLDSFSAIRNEICINFFILGSSKYLFICAFKPRLRSIDSIDIGKFLQNLLSGSRSQVFVVALIDWLINVCFLFWDHVIWDHVKKSSTELFLNWRINRIKKIRCYIFFTIFSDRKRNMYLPILFHSLIIFSLILKNIDW